MNANERPAPVGVFVVVTEKKRQGWYETECIGSIRHTQDELRVIPPNQHGSNGYRAETRVISRNAASIKLEVTQTLGDKRSLIISKTMFAARSTMWTVNSNKDGSAMEMKMYPELEALLEYLIQKG